MRLGARLNAPCEVVGLRSQASFHVIELRDGSEIPTRAVIVASATLVHKPTGRQHEIACTGVFCFIGARPATAWLADSVLLDDDGFILTDRQLPGLIGAETARALPFETSAPGVFAAGDVRHDSMKRVAAAVGEGSSAVRSVHERLATR